MHINVLHYSQVEEVLDGVSWIDNFCRILIDLFVILLVVLTLIAKSHPIAALFCGLGAVFFLILAYMMFKEYRSDLKRKNNKE